MSKICFLNFISLWTYWERTVRALCITRSWLMEYSLFFLDSPSSHSLSCGCPCWQDLNTSESTCAAYIHPHNSQVRLCAPLSSTQRVCAASYWRRLLRPLTSDRWWCLCCWDLKIGVRLKKVEDEMFNYFNSLVFRCLVLVDSRNDKTSKRRVRRPEMAKKWLSSWKLTPRYSR